MTIECALLARELHEPLRGTAPEADGWLCIQQPGPWGRDAVTSSGLPDAAATRLAAAADATPGVRVQLLRRPAGVVTSEPSAAFLVHAGATDRWVRRLPVASPAELLDIDLAVLRSPQPPDLGEPHPDPLLLVCTHAKRDACCARWGRPVAAALAERHPTLVWESSHVGGHRFAGNLVVLPAGLAHGSLGPRDALRVVERHLAGRIDLETLRGRCGLPRPAQAAEWYVRERSTARGIDDVVLTPSGSDDGARATFHATVGTARYRVAVRRAELGTPRLTGCDKDVPSDPGTWELEELTVLG